MRELLIGNIKATDLVKKYGSPLYVYDEGALISTMEKYQKGFVSKYFDTEVIFASKAFSCEAMISLVKKCGLGLDVVSGGELFTAKNADMTMEKVYFHGNNKSSSELKMAISYEVGTIVVDNYMELVSISEIAIAEKKVVSVMLRLNVGVDAHTHKYIVTSHIDSKFGMLYMSDEYQKCIQLINNCEFLKLCGFHCHIGSQIFDINPFYAAIGKMLDVLKTFAEPLVLDIGGGFGVTYTSDDKPIPVEDVVNLLIGYLEKKIVDENIKIKKLIIEPGRSIVAEAGYTLYTVGYLKKTPNKQYYFIDGGMTDNIRPALYQAKYACDIANKMDNPKTETVTIAGKCCESGDLIIEGALMPVAQKGDVLVVYSTGAYGYSMSSNYNRNTRPAVVFVNGSKAKVVVKKETYEDLVRNDLDCNDYDEF